MIKKKLIFILCLIFSFIGYSLIFRDYFISTYKIPYKHKQFGEIHYFPRGILNPIKVKNYKNLITDFIKLNLQKINLKSKHLTEITCITFKIIALKDVDDEKHVLVWFNQSPLEIDYLVFKIRKKEEIINGFY